MRTTITWIVLCILTFTSCSGDNAAVVGSKNPCEIDTATAGPPTLSFLEATSDAGRKSLVFEVVNPTDSSLYFIGYAPDYPIYSRRVEVAGEWKRVPQLLCGTGLERWELPPKSSLAFDVSPPAPGSWLSPLSRDGSEGYDNLMIDLTLYDCFEGPEEHSLEVSGVCPADVQARFQRDSAD